MFVSHLIIPVSHLIMLELLQRFVLLNVKSVFQLSFRLKPLVIELSDKVEQKSNNKLMLRLALKPNRYYFKETRLHFGACRFDPFSKKNII
jgi:hypothetical protein